MNEPRDRYFIDCREVTADEAFKELGDLEMMDLAGNIWNAYMKGHGIYTEKVPGKLSMEVTVVIDTDWYRRNDL